MFDGIDESVSSGKMLGGCEFSFYSATILGLQTVHQVLPSMLKCVPIIHIRAFTFNQTIENRAQYGAPADFDQWAEIIQDDAWSWKHLGR